jgi:replicative DNA helicase
VLARRSDKPRGRVLVVSKNRHGPLGRVELDWSGTAFAEGDGPREEVAL